MKLKELKDMIAIDIEGSLKRFGDMESFYIKFLKKFVEDKSFDNLKEALNNNDMNKVEEAAHTLKGVAGNLGLTKIYQYSSEMMKAAKEKNVTIVKELEKELREEIEFVVDKLKKLD